ncbi:solute carrier family 13 member 2-like isoform X2 [Mercenaria mercenaria]|uniref:solute carrier family 13 member 2-like isoform X2 n=1 Tax=Mercenaria mercenaria TaxID=6596 RepID=UPI00234E752F|nr:solute carrier family 13 member 2-like isoform X2 [Mercenaria mercenaria]
MGILRTLWTLRNVVIVVATPLLLLPLLLNGSKQSSAGFCLILMAVYWATEVFPIAVTALLPVMLFPMTGLMTGKAVSMTYITDSSMLFVGGLIMAAAVEHWNIHKRIALKLLLIIGTEPTRLMIGMMLPSWFLSMWTSNIATTAMMCPIADALLKELQRGEAGAIEEGCEEEQLQNHNLKQLDPCETDLDTEVVVDSTRHEEVYTSPQRTRLKPSKEHIQLAKAMTISIAYAANIGGTTTITGCASNIILKGLADEIFQERGLTSPISFGTWLVLGFPVSLLIFITLFLWLTLYFRGCSSFKKKGIRSEGIRDFIKGQYKALGPVTFPEIMVITLFIILIILWVSRDLGGAGGWGNLFKKKYVTDSAAPTLVSVLLFLIPANLPAFFKSKNRPLVVKPLLTWRTVHDKVPWGLFLLFGGGFALAQGCKESGLSESIREALTVFKELPVWLTSMLVALLTSFITEVVTNTATCTLVLPIIAQLALGIGVNPLYLMIPTAVATSYAFMLPVATPPNAMVYVLGYYSMTEMIRSGCVMNILSVFILTLGVNTWGAEYFSLRTLPVEFSDLEVTTVMSLNSTVTIAT